MSLFDRSPQGNITSPASGPQESLSQLFYSNPRLPSAFNGNAQNALDYIFSALYPNYKGTVANKAALPGSASPADYYIVADDGDGKSAGYVWVVRDNAGAFEKKYDVDWSFEGIYAETLNRTQYVYAVKDGTTDIDAAGAAITGLYAGQKLYGGDQTTQNLTFNANSADNTGYVQSDNTFRPTSDNSIDLGTSALHWRTGYFSTSLLVGTLSLSPGSVSDSSGALSFGSDNLTTTGFLHAGAITGTSLVLGTLTLGAGSISDSSGALSFGSDNLTTTGFVQGASLKTGTMTLSSGSILDTSLAISFGAVVLTTTAAINSGTAQIGGVNLSTNTISASVLNSNLNLAANGLGVINLQSAATTLGITATGTVSATVSVLTGNLSLAGNTLSSTNSNGNLVLSPNGSGIVQTTAVIKPSTDAALDLGDSTHRFKDLYFSGSISDGTTTIAQSVLQSLRGINVGVSSGMTLFWTGSQWQPSLPDTEIVHNTLSGLTTGDAGHTQFVMLAGRAGGQTVQGGTAASENLTLESTAHATKGLVLTKDSFAAFTNASFSVTWQGTDLGGSANYFRDLYTKGEHKGLRFENLSSLPSNSTQNVGRAIFNTTDKNLYIDNGTTWNLAGSSIQKYSSDTSWDGSTTVKNIDVSASISDARTAIWQLRDNTNNFEIIYTKIEATSASNVRITVSPALPAGSYRLIGMN